jgi:hypothetical protein
MGPKTKKTIRFAAAPMLVLGMGLPGLASCSAKDALDAAQGCDEFSASAGFGATLDIDARVKLFMDAAGSFQVLGQAMLADVTAACIDIATKAGGDPTKWGGKDGPDLAQAACAEASAAVTAVFTAAASAKVTAAIVIVGGECHANLDAAATCNHSCDVGGKCSAGELAAQCEPGQLAVTCGGTCSGECDVTSGSIACAGTCSAACTGDCSGTCAVKDAMGKCAGKCDGVCTGQCAGSCSATAGSTTCTGECKGTCSGTSSAPKCEGKILPPSCKGIDLDCEASCQASIRAKAECTAPTVDFEIHGVASSVPSFQATIDVLKLDLPKLLLVATARGQGVIDDVKALGQAGANLKGGLASSGKAVVCLAAALDASLKTTTNVSVSVQASVDVTASAGAH